MRLTRHQRRFLPTRPDLHPRSVGHTRDPDSKRSGLGKHAFGTKIGKCPQSPIQIRDLGNLGETVRRTAPDEPRCAYSVERGAEAFGRRFEVNGNDGLSATLTVERRDFDLMHVRRAERGVRIDRRGFARSGKNENCGSKKYKNTHRASPSV